MIGYLPWLLILACPLMMLFMMRGMGGGMGGGMGRRGDGDSAPDNRMLTTMKPPAMTGEQDRRIAELEREVAQLRSGRDASPGDSAQRPR